MKEKKYVYMLISSNASTIRLFSSYALAEKARKKYYNSYNLYIETMEIEDAPSGR
jgi:hypothetical protein